MFASIKNKRKVQKENKQFYSEHIEEFRFFVKYYPVFQSIAVAVGKEEIAKLNAEKPCVFRQESDIPFRCKCEINANDGTNIKTIKMCKECKASKGE